MKYAIEYWLPEHQAIFVWHVHAPNAADAIAQFREHDPEYEPLRWAVDRKPWKWHRITERTCSVRLEDQT